MSAFDDLPTTVCSRIRSYFRPRSSPWITTSAASRLTGRSEIFEMTVTTVLVFAIEREPEAECSRAPGTGKFPAEGCGRMYAGPGPAVGALRVLLRLSEILDAWRRRRRKIHVLRGHMSLPRLEVLSF